MVLSPYVEQKTETFIKFNRHAATFTTRCLHSSSRNSKDRQCYLLQRAHSSFSSRTFSTINSLSDHKILKARSCLGLSRSLRIEYSGKEIRDAYFIAAKQCHPDVVGKKPIHRGDVPNSGDDKKKDAEVAEAAKQFIAVTEAYEILLSMASDKYNSVLDEMEIDEEEEYRQACMDFLHLPAEVVEESKQCPMFRKWLMGNIDSAAHWRYFLQMNGGLAPRLKKSVLQLQASSDESASYNSDNEQKQKVRRRKKR